jgi:hypothetical protein
VNDVEPPGRADLVQVATLLLSKEEDGHLIFNLCLLERKQHLAQSVVVPEYLITFCYMRDLLRRITKNRISREDNAQPTFELHNLA